MGSSVQLQDFAAGWVGGAASVVVGHPLDTVKTRLQAGQGYGNTLNCVLTVYRNESVAGFFKGMAFPLATIAVYSSVVFGVFSNTQRLLGQRRRGEAAPALRDTALASAVAGAVSVAIGTPVDLVKIRLQMQTQPLLRANVPSNPAVPGLPVYRGPIHCFRTVLQQEGITGIYRGAGAMLLRDVPGYCLYFIPYVLFCAWITPEGCLSPSPSSVWLAGGVAGAISWGTATPMDVVKSRLQADGVYVNRYKGILDCILQSYRSEGLKWGETESYKGSLEHLASKYLLMGACFLLHVALKTPRGFFCLNQVFFRGITVNAVRGFPMSSAMFLGYELSLKAMKRDQSETSP